jgi:alcohol dehydrogenase
MDKDIELELRKFVAPEFVFGPGARFLVGRYARNFGARRALVVTDQGLIDAGWTGQVVENLEEASISYAVFKDLTCNPKDHEVMAGAEMYRAQRCNTIIAVGGGSPMDCAKGIGIVTANGGNILDYEGVDRVEHPLDPLICVPTTAGTSADVSQFAIVSDTQRHVKIAIVSKAIVPDVALIDPDTTSTMDAALTAHTGLDALVHAFEAYVSNANSPITDIHALEAIRVIAQTLPKAVCSLHDIELRKEMMLGSLFAGLAFSNASLGAVHAMAHSLGGLLDAPHGVCNAILLERVVSYNFLAAVERYRKIGKAMSLDLEPLDDQHARETLVEALAALRRGVGVQVSLGELGMRSEHVAELARNAMHDACIVTNPKSPDRSDIEKIYEQAL